MQLGLTDPIFFSDRYLFIPYYLPNQQFSMYPDCQHQFLNLWTPCLCHTTSQCPCQTTNQWPCQLWWPNCHRQPHKRQWLTGQQGMHISFNINRINTMYRLKAYSSKEFLIKKYRQTDGLAFREGILAARNVLNTYKGHYQFVPTNQDKLKVTCSQNVKPTNVGML